MFASTQIVMFISNVILRNFHLMKNLPIGIKHLSVRDKGHLTCKSPALKRFPKLHLWKTRFNTE